MWDRLKGTIRFIGEYFAARTQGVGSRAADVARNGTARALNGLHSARWALFGLGLFGGAGYLLYLYPPVKTVGRGEAGNCLNRLTGGGLGWRGGGRVVGPPRSHL